MGMIPTPDQTHSPMRQNPQATTTTSISQPQGQMQGAVAAGSGRGNVGGITMSAGLPPESNARFRARRSRSRSRYSGWAALHARAYALLYSGSCQRPPRLPGPVGSLFSILSIYGETMAVCAASSPAAIDFCRAASFLGSGCSMPSAVRAMSPMEVRASVPRLSDWAGPKMYST